VEIESTVLRSDIEEIYDRNLELIQSILGKQVLITGAGGFLGRYFISLFLHANRMNKATPISVVALENYVTQNATADEERFKTLDKNIEWIFGDAIIGAELPNKFDFVIHAAGIASPEHYRANPLETIHVAVDVTRKLLEKCVINKSKMLFFSSSEIYGNPPASAIPTKEEFNGYVASRGPRACYDESKRLGETLCWIFQEYYGVNVSVVRPFNVYGPGMLPRDFRVLPNFANQIIKGKKLFVYGSGDQTRTFCYVVDAMDGFIKVLLDTGKSDVYNVGNPKPEITINTLAEMVCDAFGTPDNFEQIPYPESYPDDEPTRRCPDISKIQTALDFYPEISLEEGLLRFMKWASENYPSLQ
jgi:UDP-glucuronate decarboxylase